MEEVEVGRHVVPLPGSQLGGRRWGLTQKADHPAPCSRYNPLCDPTANTGDAGLFLTLQVGIRELGCLASPGPPSSKTQSQP